MLVHLPLKKIRVCSLIPGPFWPLVKVSLSKTLKPKLASALHGNSLPSMCKSCKCVNERQIVLWINAVWYMWNDLQCCLFKPDFDHGAEGCFLDRKSLQLYRHWCSYQSLQHHLEWLTFWFIKCLAVGVPLLSACSSRRLCQSWTKMTLATSFVESDSPSTERTCTSSTMSMNPALTTLTSL